MPSNVATDNVVQEFPAHERDVLLQVKGVGPTVIARLQQLGFHSLTQLARAKPGDIVSQAAAMLDSSCWRNSPQARAAITGAIDAAREYDNRVQLRRTGKAL